MTIYEPFKLSISSWLRFGSLGFLKNWPIFFLNCQIISITVQSILLLLFMDAGVIFCFFSDIGDLSYLFLIFVHIARGYQFYWFLSNNQICVLLIFSILFLFSTSLISAYNFLPSTCCGFTLLFSSFLR